MNKRCAWVNDNPLYIDYHDHEWGVPVYDERVLFEFLILEGMQAGLSWLTVLKKREHFRRVFDNFEVQLVADYDEDKFDALMADSGIIRNKLKIRAAITNAQAVLKIKAELGDFSSYIWRFVGGQPIQNHWESIAQVPAKTVISDAMSKDLLQRGFKFVGSTICYAFMQATGMVNDHTVHCCCYKK